MAKMVRGFVFPLRLDPYGPVTHAQKVIAYRSDTPGLMVTRGPAGGWLVFLEEHGYVVASGVAKKDTAIQMAEALGTWGVDWTQDPDHLRSPQLQWSVAELTRLFISREGTPTPKG